MDIVQVERIVDCEEPCTLYKLPSGFEGKVIVVYEDPVDLDVRLETEEEWERLKKLKS